MSTNDGLLPAFGLYFRLFSTLFDVFGHIVTPSDNPRQFGPISVISGQLRSSRANSVHFSTYPVIYVHFGSFQDISGQFRTSTAISEQFWPFQDNYCHFRTIPVIPDHFRAVRCLTRFGPLIINQKHSATLTPLFRRSYGKCRHLSPGFRKMSKKVEKRLSFYGKSRTSAPIR